MRPRPSCPCLQDGRQAVRRLLSGPSDPTRASRTTPATIKCDYHYRYSTCHCWPASYAKGSRRVGELAAQPSLKPLKQGMDHGSCPIYTTNTIKRCTSSSFSSQPVTSAPPTTIPTNHRCPFAVPVRRRQLGHCSAAWPPAMAESRCWPQS